jgi:signal transduction histidine kinase
MIDRRVEVTIQRPDEPLLVWGNQAQLRQAILNLLLNARDATIERLEAEPEFRNYRPRISVAFPDATTAIATVTDVPGRPSIELRVTDNGAGMPAETKERVFDPFFTTKAVDRGTGLGLSTAYGIVTDIGGTITVESTQGKGTTLTLLLPSAAAPRPPQTSSTPGNMPEGGRTT